MSNRKIQLRLYPYTDTSRVIEYRIDPSELGWFKRTFCNGWKMLETYHKGWMRKDDLESGYLPFLATSEEFQNFKRKVYDEKTLNEYIASMTDQFNEELKEKEISWKAFSEIEY